MGLIEMASGKSVWRGMDYYESKKVTSWNEVSYGIYEGIVLGSEGKNIVSILKRCTLKNQCAIAHLLMDDE